MEYVQQGVYDLVRQSMIVRTPIVAEHGPLRGVASYKIASSLDPLQ